MAWSSTIHRVLVSYFGLPRWTDENSLAARTSKDRLSHQLLLRTDSSRTQPLVASSKDHRSTTAVERQVSPLHLLPYNNSQCRLSLCRLAIYASLSRHNTSAALLQSLEMQLNRTEETLLVFDREKAMLSLLARFEVEKSRLDPDTRHQLRHRFLRLQSNQSRKINKTAIMLANSAHKLPDGNSSLHHFIMTPHAVFYLILWSIDVTRVVFQQIKTEKHLELERALKSTKQTVLELMAKKSLTRNEMRLVQRLRKNTIQIIRELTNEIKCAAKVIVCNRTSQPASVASEYIGDPMRILCWWCVFVDSTHCHSHWSGWSEWLFCFCLEIEWKYRIKKDAGSGFDHRMDVLVIVLSCVMFCFFKAVHRTYRRLFEWFNKVELVFLH